MNRDKFQRDYRFPIRFSQKSKENDEFRQRGRRNTNQKPEFFFLLRFSRHFLLIFFVVFTVCIMCVCFSCVGMDKGEKDRNPNLFFSLFASFLSATLSLDLPHFLCVVFILCNQWRKWRGCEVLLEKQSIFLWGVYLKKKSRKGSLWVYVYVAVSVNGRWTRVYMVRFLRRRW